jgi:pentatricopeptide repeat domain-containing protein 1
VCPVRGHSHGKSFMYMFLCLFLLTASAAAFSAEREATRAIARHASNGQWRKALQLLRTLPDRGVTVNVIHYNAVIKACSRGGQWKLAIALLREMTGSVKDSQTAAPAADAWSFSTAISALSAAPQEVGWQTCLELLDQMPEASTAAHNAALRLAGRDGTADGARRTLQMLRTMSAKGPPPDLLSFNLVLDAFKARGEWKPALELLAELEKHASLRPDVVSYSSAIAAIAPTGEWREACRLLDRMRAANVPPNEFSYGAAISACDAGGEWVRAVALLRELEKSHAPSLVAYTSAISACAKDGAWQQALRLLVRMPLIGLQPNAIQFNAAISACAKAKEWRPALALLRRMRGEANANDKGRPKQRRRRQLYPSPNVVSYNAAISACARGGVWREALALLRQMRTDGLTPDMVSYSTALDALARGAQGRAALGIITGMRQKGIEPDAIALCAACRACEAAGEWRGALLVLRPVLQAEPVFQALPETRTASGAAPQALPTRATTMGDEELAPAFAAACRSCARAGEGRVARMLADVAEARMGRPLPSTVLALVDAAEAAPHTAALRTEAEIAPAPAAPAVAAAMETAADIQTQAMPGVRTAKSTAPQQGGRPTRASARANFVLEGAQVSCTHGENASSAVDIFLTRGADGSIAGAVDIAREARVLVHALQRRAGYVPVLTAAPVRSGRGERLSSARRRRLLSQHAEKKALAAQLRMGYPAPWLELSHWMCADCHAFFRAAAVDSQRPIVCIDARVRHEFGVDGRCSCETPTCGR